MNPVLLLFLAFALVHVAIAVTVSIKKRRHTPGLSSPDDPTDEWDRRGPIGEKSRHLLPWGISGRRRDG